MAKQAPNDENPAQSQPAKPADPEPFSRTAPQWNCVDYPNEGMHYTSGKHGGCAWCGKTREQIAAEPQPMSYCLTCEKPIYEGDRVDNYGGRSHYACTAK